jgi:hypothetical protein
MTSTSTSRLLPALAAAVLASACIAETGRAEEEVVQQEGALLGVDEFLYFRSNATSWNVDESTRLFPFAGTGTFARLYAATEPWMVSDADTAIVTRTNQLDGWGTSQTFYGATSKRLVVPARDTLTAQAPGGDAHFKVKYPAVGSQRVIVSFASTPPTIQIDDGATACSGVCPGGLRCVLLPPVGIPTCVEDSPGGP